MHRAGQHGGIQCDIGFRRRRIDNIADNLAFAADIHRTGAVIGKGHGRVNTDNAGGVFDDHLRITVVNLADADIAAVYGRVINANVLPLIVCHGGAAQ
ncbi:hypothetical protein SRABI106_01267 [Rahnella aquatilis]|nr:hypothetical protein SRABI106_01267 [Rahnella aquatilis]